MGETTKTEEGVQTYEKTILPEDIKQGIKRFDAQTEPQYVTKEEEKSDKNEKKTVKGEFIIHTYRDCITDDIYTADAYTVETGIPESSLVEVQIRKSGCPLFKRYSKLLGHEVIITDVKTGQCVFNLCQKEGEAIPQIKSIARGHSRVDFWDGITIECHKDKYPAYEKMISAEYMEARARGESLDRVQMRISYKLQATYVMGYITQRDYVSLMASQTSLYEKIMEERSQAEEPQEQAEKNNPVTSKIVQTFFSLAVLNRRAVHDEDTTTSMGTAAMLEGMATMLNLQGVYADILCTEKRNHVERIKIEQYEIWSNGTCDPEQFGAAMEHYK